MPRMSPISYVKLCDIFLVEGFVYSRTKGDHIIYIRAGAFRPLVIPRYDEVPVFIIKNLLRTAGISRERYFELLNR